MDAAEPARAEPMVRHRLRPRRQRRIRAVRRQRLRTNPVRQAKARATQPQQDTIQRAPASDHTSLQVGRGAGKARDKETLPEAGARARMLHIMARHLVRQAGTKARKRDGAVAARRQDWLEGALPAQVSRVSATWRAKTASAGRRQMLRQALPTVAKATLGKRQGRSPHNRPVPAKPPLPAKGKSLQASLQTKNPSRSEDGCC